jgi:hypothetical protein
MHSLLSLDGLPGGLTGGLFPLDGIDRTDFVTFAAVGTGAFVDNVNRIIGADRTYRANRFAGPACDTIISNVMRTHWNTSFTVWTDKFLACGSRPRCLPNTLEISREQYRNGTNSIQTRYPERVDKAYIQSEKWQAGFYL